MEGGFTYVHRATSVGFVILDVLQEFVVVLGSDIGVAFGDINQLIGIRIEVVEFGWCEVAASGHGFPIGFDPGSLVIPISGSYAGVVAEGSDDVVADGIISSIYQGQQI